jgi:general secretion pathway protein G
MNATLQRLREARRDEGGFTLIELLIVIVILGVLAGVVVFAVSGIQDRGKTSACKADVTTTRVAVEAYYAKTGGYPVGDNTALTPLTTGADKLLNSVPADITYTGTAAAYTLAGVGCTV